MTFEELKDKALSLPFAPGVYIMRDAGNKVIYVGKAKKLKNRVSQYFQDSAAHTPKTRAMVSKIDHFDVIVAASEFEALVLECSLIKRYLPKYNILLKDDKADRYDMTEEERAEYESLLNVSGNGIIGYIEIPMIQCSLPIYHGTEESVLQIAVGHIEGSSLPTGGAGTHCVLSGHRGLPSAKLFTDLDQLAEGDTFMLRILDETLTYEVDQIRTVEPYELDDLGIEEGKDYCTLVTCTPYGINTHRLLVRGRRVDNQPEARTVRVTADAMQIEPVLVAPLVAVPMLFVLLILLLVKTRRKK